MCRCGMRPKSKEEHNAELRKDAERIVAGVESYSGTVHTRREAELKAAFPPAAKTTVKVSVKPAAKSAAKKTVGKPAAKPAAKAKTTAKTVAKATGKGPTPAGMSVGAHDGDVC